MNASISYRGGYPTDTAGLTARQREVMAWIERYQDRHGLPPTIREIGAALEIRSPNGVICRLRALKRLGYLGHKDCGTARSWRILRRLDEQGLSATAGPSGITIRCPDRPLSPDEAHELAGLILDALDSPNPQQGGSA